jgi:hypothetical protein
MTRRARAERVRCAVGRVAAVASAGVAADALLERIVHEAAALAPGAAVAVARGAGALAVAPGGVAVPIRAEGGERVAVHAVPPLAGALPEDLADVLGRLVDAAERASG